MSKANPPKGFTCSKCGTYHDFALYVYAHWHDDLIHNCECGAKHRILMGKATHLRGGKKK